MYKKLFEKEFDRVIPLGQTHKNLGRISNSIYQSD